MAQYDVIELYPTNHCTLHCLGCYLNKSTNEWSKETTQKIIDSGVFKRVEKEINILGGEPTEWKFLLDFISSIRNENLDVSISITTNAVRFIDDKEYFKDFLRCCVVNRVKINVSWHNDKRIVPILQELKKHNILDAVIFVPTSTLDLEPLEHTFKTLSALFHCVWRPLILKEPSLFAKKITNFLLTQSKNTIQSGVRFVNKQKTSNLELVGKSNLDKDFYKSFDCMCGRNGVIFTDGKLYHCLSQAMEGDKPISPANTKEKRWVSCKYDYCCCDTFNLKTRKES